jgi:histidyl-tRNA synthetase
MQAMIAGGAEARRLPRGGARALRGLQAQLTDAGLAYTIDPRLVRGLDYYNRTCSSGSTTAARLGAQGTVAGGGRYDALFETLGGKPSFACGFAIGVERTDALVAGDDAI